MSNAKAPTKKQLIETIEKLQNDPSDMLGGSADLLITALGASGFGAAAAFFGATTASIPIITAVTGIGMVVAAPVTLVAGAAVAGGAAIYGLSRIIKGDGYGEGKKRELLNR